MTHYTKNAKFSDCHRYRYLLTRTWNWAGPAINFVMLNPSTADHETDDPTIRRCVDYARSWGYGRLLVTNLFALRATDPMILKAAEDPIGPKNDDYLANAAVGADKVICAWGNQGKYQSRAPSVAALLAGYHDLYALKVTLTGEPGHPLYLPKLINPVLFRRMAQ